jgi:ribosome modulation factor
MTYPEFREQEEEVKSSALERFQQHCDEEFLFKYFWFGVETGALGRDYDTCPFSSGKYRGAFLAGMEWFNNYNSGNDFISPERIAGMSITGN